MQATGSCYNIRTTLRFRNRPSNRSALRNRPAAARPRRHFTGCLSQADPGCLRSSPNLPTLPQGRAGDAPLLRHAKHRFSQPHSPERVQVFPTDSKGVQGTRPETEHRVSEEVGEGLTGPTEPPGASRQRVWCCCVLTGPSRQQEQQLCTAGPKKSWDPWDRAGSGSRSVPRHSNSLLRGAAGWGCRCARQARGKLAEMKGALLLPPLRAAAVDAGSFHARGSLSSARLSSASQAATQ